MKIPPPAATDPGRRLDQAYGVRSDRQQAVAEAVSALLDPGRLLKGRVLSVDGGGLVTVSTEQGSFAATTATPLAVGQELWLQVVRGGTTPLLAEAGKANAVMNLLRILLPGMTAEFGNRDLAPTGSESKPSPEASRLSAFWAANGLDASPDPLKLLKAVAHFSADRGMGQPNAHGLDLTPAAGDFDSPPAAVQKLAQLLDAHALVNQQPPLSGRQDYCIYPLFFADGASRGEWLYSFEQGGNEGGQEENFATLSFYLAMTRLGDIHLNLNMRPHGLSGVFTMTTAEAADHLRHQLPQLVTALEPLAGRVVITCRTAPFDSLRALKDDLTAKAGVERYALVDIKA